VFHNVKIVGNGNILLCYAEFKNLNTSNATVCINLKTTANSVIVAKLMKRLTHHTSNEKRQTVPAHL